MRWAALACVFIGASCTSGTHAGGSSGTSGSGSTSSGGTSGSGTTSGGGSSGGTTGAPCPTTPHCVGGNFWTTDCNGFVDGGNCAPTLCNATGTACVIGRAPSCATDADCVCGYSCSAGNCVQRGNVPKNPCASDLDCGPTCAGLTCVDGGCEALICGPVTCAPGCSCGSYGVCDCPPLPDAGSECTSYDEIRCIYPCGGSLPDGGCDCGGGPIDANGDCGGECLKDRDCDAGFHCDLDPNAFAPYEQCVQCTASSQCNAGTVCDTARNLCVADCRLDGGDCDAGCSQAGVCGECSADADCPGGSTCAIWPDGGETYGLPSTCRSHCQGDAGCSAPHPVCDPTLGYCVDCLQNADCAACTPRRPGSCASGFCLSTIACY